VEATCASAPELENKIVHKKREAKTFVDKQRIQQKPRNLIGCSQWEMIQHLYLQAAAWGSIANRD